MHIKRYFNSCKSGIDKSTFVIYLLFHSLFLWWEHNHLPFNSFQAYQEITVCAAELLNLVYILLIPSFRSFKNSSHTVYFDHVSPLPALPRHTLFPKYPNLCLYFIFLSLKTTKKKKKVNWTQDPTPNQETFYIWYPVVKRKSVVFKSSNVYYLHPEYSSIFIAHI